MKLITEMNRQQIKLIGQILASEAGWKILNAISVKKMYPNQIATELGLNPSTVHYQLAKIDKTGLSTTTHEPICKDKKIPGIIQVDADGISFVNFSLDKNTHSSYIEKMCAKLKLKK